MSKNNKNEFDKIKNIQKNHKNNENNLNLNQNFGEEDFSNNVSFEVNSKCKLNIFK